ncbi:MULTISPECIES: MFS transporter [unclassified Bombella]|uniref:MFS transporter n=1 Tax=unclassified Bombella TaxID=2644098 RepID=UPI001E5CE6C9|nr:MULTISPECIES: MFS transporter [unclassified Bombella]MCT6855095.1 MFS transporter [Bombella apis]
MQAIRAHMTSIIGLAGVLLVAVMTTLNEQVSLQGLGDIMGGMGLSRDPSRWFVSLYTSAQVIGAGLSPWMAITFSLRRWALFVLALALSSIVPMTFCTMPIAVYSLRSVQGLAGGFAIPLLMFSILRILPFHLRAYGLVAYTLVSTCFPYLGTALAGIWTDFFSWRFIFLQAIPLGALAGACIWYGMPVTEPQHHRLKRFNGYGLLFFVMAAWCLTTVLSLGDWLDWFNSSLICVLSVIGVAAIPLLVWNEWRHPLPFFRFQLLSRNNYFYGVGGISLFVVISLSASAVPLQFLTKIVGYRPEQSYLITLEVAAVEILVAPFVGYLLNRREVDCRIIGFSGMVCMFIACCGDSLVTSVWQRPEFYLWQFLQGIGGVMVLASLLMMSTNAVVAEESPFAVALVNMPRAFMMVGGTWLVDLVTRWRGGLHEGRLADRLGQYRYALVQGSSPLLQSPTPFLPDGTPRYRGSMAYLKQQFHHQATVLTLSDLFCVLAALLVVLMVFILIVPVRTYPPWVVFAPRVVTSPEQPEAQRGEGVEEE